MNLKVISNYDSSTALCEVVDKARVCYTNKIWEDIKEEGISLFDRIKLLNKLIENGHHSPFDHVQVSIYLEGIPKILAMFLNNEKYYATSEKSFRYTQTKLEGIEKILYDKWSEKLIKVIRNRYPSLPEKKVNSLASENARYFLSVFTPTNMVYTTSLRQLNYISYLFKDFIEEAHELRNEFMLKVSKHMEQFRSLLKKNGLIVQIGNGKEYLTLNPNFRTLSLMNVKEMNCLLAAPMTLDYNYNMNYKQSFAYLAQAQRHRTTNYKIISIPNPDDCIYFIPYIFEDKKELSVEWVRDMDLVKTIYPQGMLIDIYESGDITSLISKCGERLCGHAQFEIMWRTKKTLGMYAVYNKNPEIGKLISPYLSGPKCTFPNGSCTDPCGFGRALDRLI